MECLASAEKCFREAYRFTNTRATEVLVLMVSDLDRLYGPRHKKTCLRGVANNAGADQPAHPRSLISAFVIRAF